MDSQTLPTKRNISSLGILYALAIVILGAFINYLAWAKGEDFTPRKALFLMLVAVLLYLPVYIFPRYDNWPLREFGFVINGMTIFLASMVIILSICTASIWPVASLKFAFFEAIARTGEELFFRGFLYSLIIQVRQYKNELLTHLGAILLSSLAFAVVHTQTFFPENTTTMIQVFLFGLFVAFLRLWSGSILPGIILHLLFNTGELISVIFGVLIYVSFVFWAYRRGESW